MTSPTADEILEIFEDLNYPSATKLRAALIKKGYKARQKDVDEFVKSQTPTQLFAKAPKYRGKIIASRPNDRWVMDFIDYSAEPSGEYKYILLVQDIFSRKLWATGFTDKPMSSVVAELRSMFSDSKPREINADGEFDNPTINGFLSRNNIAARFKEGRNDLAVIDANMNNFKKMLKKMMQEQNTKNWQPLVPKATRAHNKMMHEALIGNADPNEAYDEDNKNLAFELREEAGKKMAQQDAVVRTNQKNMVEQGGFRDYIGREDIRRRGDRPQYSGEVKLVSAVEGNRVKDSSGQTHSMTTTKPVPEQSASTTINVRLVGSTQTEERKREEFKKYAEALRSILAAEGSVFTSRAVTELMKREPNYKKDLGKMTFGNFVKLYPKLFELQTSAAGGTSKVRLRSSSS